MKKRVGALFLKVLLIFLRTSWQTLELSTLVLMGRLSLGQIGVKVWQILRNALIKVFVIENDKLSLPRLVLSIYPMQIQTIILFYLTPIWSPKISTALLDLKRCGLRMKGIELWWRMLGK